MILYQDLLNRVLNFGETRTDRTGVGTISIFGAMFVHDLTTGFPAVTVKALPFKVMAAELACFVKGLTDIREFQKRGCHIWDENWADFVARSGIAETSPDYYDLGPIYGAQWRNFNGMHVDQLRRVLAEAKNRPDSRRLLVTSWNPLELDESALPPCHTHWQISVRESQYLDMAFYMRSVDLCLGFPFDIASYALFCHLIANELGLIPRKLICYMADAHIYTNHIDGALTMVERAPKPLPRLELLCCAGMPVEEFEPEMAVLSGYDPHPAIKLKMAV